VKIDLQTKMHNANAVSSSHSVTHTELSVSGSSKKPQWVNTTASPLPPIINGSVNHEDGLITSHKPNDGQHQQQLQIMAPSAEHLNVQFESLTQHNDSLAPSTEPMNVSLHVCRQCQDGLMAAFEHCLSRHSNHDSASIPVLDSIHNVDEIADATQLCPPPYVQLVADPTVKPRPIYDEFLSKMERERGVGAVGFKGAVVKGGIGPVGGGGTGAGMMKGPWIGTSRFFSGGIFKRTLEAKDREIRMLRDQLFDRVRAESLEHQNVERLKHALDKSMKYYYYAEDWQKNESARLQQDVRYLKAELSSLMAFLINSEEEKRQV
jgi:hypothetical protein